ncbi:flavin oxidoreductase [Intrasporangium oryzae NRRL B-24470]|uniref:Flavin oxidoreductase n=1 Tax=Intrasporangium oryzae NRRL B-24470 TaxID=1386089 RepID=W9GA07_9MICO|nr:flavin reductase family protein [Intrasporangium oryzae]EWT02915.1 flavin oxidoreductase [Intrasporangium oryzae NRRL B-24470]
MTTAPTPAQMRHALGHFATGVTIVTGYGSAGEPVGFACQSFASVSLDPPLVLFCADHRGRSWPRMRDQGRFTVNMLGHAQRDLIDRFGSSSGARFQGLDWEPSARGGPNLPGVLMRVHCAVEQVHVAGDHDVVIGRVNELEDGEPGRPMLFYRGRFSVTERRTSSARDEGPEPPDDYWG